MGPSVGKKKKVAKLHSLLTSATLGNKETPGNTVRLTIWLFDEGSRGNRMAKPPEHRHTGSAYWAKLFWHYRLCPRRLLIVVCEELEIDVRLLDLML